jgi:hypothetical protein
MVFGSNHHKTHFDASTFSKKFSALVAEGSVWFMYSLQAGISCCQVLSHKQKQPPALTV